MAMSSTTSTRSGSAARMVSSAARGAVDMWSMTLRLGISMRNVVPLPSSLAAVIVPSALSTIRLTIGRPSPVPLRSPPLLLRMRLAMSCTNGSKSLDIFSSEMPQPVSVTSSVSMCVAAAQLMVTTISPRSVNFAALPTRLIRIWRIPCWESSTTGMGTSPLVSMRSFTPCRRTR